MPIPQRLAMGFFRCECGKLHSRGIGAFSNVKCPKCNRPLLDRAVAAVKK